MIAVVVYVLLLLLFCLFVCLFNLYCASLFFLLYSAPSSGRHQRFTLNRSISLVLLMLLMFFSCIYVLVCNVHFSSSTANEQGPFAHLAKSCSVRAQYR